MNYPPMQLEFYHTTESDRPQDLMARTKSAAGPTAGIEDNLRSDGRESLDSTRPSFLAGLYS